MTIRKLAVVAGVLFCGVLFRQSAWSAGKYGEIIASIRTGVFEPYRIGVDDFIPKDPAAPEAVRQTARQISDIVRDDLEYSYLFATRAPDPEYLKVFGVEKLSLYDWEKLYVGFVLVGDVETDGTEAIILSYTLYSVHKRLKPEEISSRRIRASARELRLLAHSIADDIYKQITDLQGIFRSRIAYSHIDSVGKEIFICDVDGHMPLRATFDRSINVSPRWASADEISYTSFKGNNPDLWLLNMREGKNRRLSSFPGLNSAAAWSPDGYRFAVTLTKDGNPEIYVFSKGEDKGERITFTPGIDSSPTWSPDGKYLAFTSDRSGKPQVYIMDVDGGNVQRLTYQGGHNDSPAWSPTLDLIAYVSRGPDRRFDIWTTTINGTHQRQLTSVGDNENPQWSPDGLHLVYSSTRSGSEEIYTMDFAGQNVRRITHGGGNSNPSWSPR
jgi:TolB protein